MIFVAACPNCSSTKWSIFGAAIEEGTLHPVQCRCCSCGLIFANPRASEAELDEFYRSYYATKFPAYLLPGAAYEDRVGEVAGHLRSIVGGRRGRMLEIGFGSGAILSAARSLGFEVYGLELSQQAVDTARARGLEHTWCSSLEDQAFASAHFDVIYAWHVIEHVADLDAFVRELYRVLKPGGLLFIGTESGAHVVGALFRAWSLLRGKVPRPITATEHTFVFSPHSLRNVLERRGFVIERLLNYDEVRDRSKGIHGSSPLKRMAYRLVVSVAQTADRLIKRGPYLKCFATKRDGIGSGDSPRLYETASHGAPSRVTT